MFPTPHKNTQTHIPEAKTLSGPGVRLQPGAVTKISEARA